MFDMGGVLAEFGWDAIFSHYFAPEDVPLAQSVILRKWRLMDGGMLDYDAYVAESAALLPERLRPNCARFFAEWITAMTPIEGVWALAARMKARGKGVYLLSNATVDFARRAPEVFPILRLFDGIIFSANIRMLKPDAEIYEYALEHFGIAASETLFVDDMSENVEGARRCGLHAHRFTGDVAALEHAVAELEK